MTDRPDQEEMRENKINVKREYVKCRKNVNVDIPKTNTHTRCLKIHAHSADMSGNMGESLYLKKYTNKR